MEREWETLADLSSLTKIQVETLKIRRSVASGEITVNSAVKLRKDSGVSRGTYYRILAQARKNVKESLFTIATAIQLGFVNAEDVQKLIVTVSMVPESVSAEKSREIVALAKALGDRIVMT